MNAQPSQDQFEMNRGATLKARKASSSEKSGMLAYRKEELSKAIEDTYLVNESFHTRYSTFWDALDNAYSDFFIMKSRAPASTGTSQKLFDAPALFHTAVQSIKVLSSDPATGSEFSSRNGKIQVKDGAVQFIPALDERKSTESRPVKKTLTYEDAFNAILIVQANRPSREVNTLIIEGGTREERLMYTRAVHAYNASVVPELRLNLPKGFKAPAWDMMPVNTASKKFAQFMCRAEPFPEPPSAEKKNSDAEQALKEVKEKVAKNSGPDKNERADEKKADDKPKEEPEILHPEDVKNGEEFKAKKSKGTIIDLNAEDFEEVVDAPPANNVIILPDLSAKTEPTDSEPDPLLVTNDKLDDAAGTISAETIEEAVIAEAKNPDASAATLLTLEEKHIYINEKLEAIYAHLAENKKGILKQSPVDTTGGTPARNVYLVQMKEYPGDQTYVTKIKGELVVIYTRDNFSAENLIVARNDEIYRLGDMDHPKHPLHDSAQIAKELRSSGLASDFRVSTTYTLPEGSYMIDSFGQAAAPQKKPPTSSAKAAVTPVPAGLG